MAGLLCKIGSKKQMREKAAALVAQGVSDPKIAEQRGLHRSKGDVGRVRMSRHRKKSIEAAARALAEGASRRRDLIDWPGLEAIARDLRGTVDRLERALTQPRMTSVYRCRTTVSTRPISK